MTSDKDILCPNCENSFHSKYDFCPHCGQRNKEIRMGLKFLFEDFLAGSFNIDSKFFSTFRVLIFKPARLTKEFLNGKRTKYLTPLRIYLLVSFAYFAMLSLTDVSALKFSETQELADVPVVFNESEIDSVLFNNDTITLNDSTSQTLDFEIDSTGSVLGIDMSTLKSLNQKKARQEFKDKFNDYISVSMFFIMPIAAIFLLWFFGKGTYYFEHLIFLIHLQSLVFILLIISGLLFYAFPYSIIELIGNIIIFGIIVLWIKSFYGYRWIKSIFASLLFFISYILVLGITFIGLAYVSLLIM